MTNKQAHDGANAEPKNVLQLCHSYSMPFHDVARQYTALFKETGYRVVTVFLTGKTCAEIEAVCASDEVIFLEYTSKDLCGLKRRQIKAIRGLHNKYLFDFAIAHRYKSLYIASHVPDLFVMGVQHAFGGYGRFMRRWYVTRKQDRIALIGISNAIRDDMRQHLPKVAPERIQTLYNRIDVEALEQRLVDRETARKALGLPPEGYVFGNVGRLHPDKDQATLLRAFARSSDHMPDSMVAIVGKGHLEQSLKDLADELGVRDRVHFTGVVPDAARYFKAFDAFVLTSDHEPFGMVLLEAMVAGLPMAVCDSGGAPEVVQGLAKMFDLRDDATLSRHMVTLYKMSADTVSNEKKKLIEKVESDFSDVSVKTLFWNICDSMGLRE
ncbi:glycosyltransferase [Endozoicomonas ascidiicola]|uniref:glycosyltransferase n=1 Tax=Endozoicomonas ascidiicola TaxID=1698521 RepID=UPI0008319C1E|nr:glycosyltransferase [Endozoicomonas ascidiicola]